VGHADVELGVRQQGGDGQERRLLLAHRENEGANPVRRHPLVVRVELLGTTQTRRHEEERQHEKADDPSRRMPHVTRWVFR